MKAPWTLLAAATLPVLLVALSCNAPKSIGRQATTLLVGTDGKPVGFASLADSQAGVRVTLHVDGLSAGSYRYGFFEEPSCEAPSFMTAGIPFPEEAEKAMLRNMSPALSRSIGRLSVDAEGVGRAEEVAPVVTLGSGDNSLFEGGGSALIVLQLPAGGTRVACGVIRP